MPVFPTFRGDDGSVSFRDHIFKFSNHYVAFEDNPNYKLRLFRNSLVGLASQWMKPEMSINDLVEVKQYEHESTEDFMMRFRRTRIRCQFPINHAQLIFVAQKALWLPLRKKFYDVQFNELQELVIATTKYEKLLLEEHKAAIHQVDFEELKPEQNDGHGREGMDMCVAEMTTPFKPLIVKGLVQPVKDQKVVMNDDGFIPMKPPKY
ncbi:hypothetical protein ACFX14_018908 [Malus domestica]